MAISQHEQEQSPSSLLDALYCEEEKWEDEEEEYGDEGTDEIHNHGVNKNQSSSSTSSLLPILLLEQDLFWEDKELLCLFNKEKQGVALKDDDDGGSLICARKEAVEWMLKVNSRYGFCTLTSILCVNYFDRFLSSFPLQNHKHPWTIQLAAVTCLSLAAKVEETNVPLLLDLQIEGARPVFEPQVIQKMELLVLSTLDWKMHPVTPLSFLDHIIRRLGLKNHLHWEFLKRCERLLLSLLSDWRFVSYLPSVLATATMMHVIDQIEPWNPLEYQIQLLSVLNFSKEKVNDCYELIVERASSGSIRNNIPNSKRKYDQMTINNNTTVVPSSPSGVTDAYYFSSDSSNDSWASSSATASNTTGPISASSSVSSSPVVSRKRGRVHEQPMPLQLPSLSRVFVDVIGSPR